MRTDETKAELKDALRAVHSDYLWADRSARLMACCLAARRDGHWAACWAGWWGGQWVSWMDARLAVRLVSTKAEWRARLLAESSDAHLVECSAVRRDVHWAEQKGESLAALKGTRWAVSKAERTEQHWAAW